VVVYVFALSVEFLLSIDLICHQVHPAINCVKQVVTFVYSARIVPIVSDGVNH